MTGNRLWTTRMPANGPADTPTSPTALWMYSLRQLSSTCLSRPGKLWLYSGATITSPSAARDRGREGRVLDRFAGIVHRKGHGGDVDHLAADTGTAVQQIGHQVRRMHAGATLCGWCRE